MSGTLMQMQMYIYAHVSSCTGRFMHRYVHALVGSCRDMARSILVPSCPKASLFRVKVTQQGQFFKTVINGNEVTITFFVTV